VKRSQGLDQAERRAAKVRNLEATSMVLAEVCEKLEKLVALSEDPRIAGGRTGDIMQTVMSITVALLQTI
jgi:hypothetical protein